MKYFCLGLIGFALWSIVGSAETWPPQTSVSKISGFRLTKLDPESVFQKAGLREGDLVISLNNKAVESDADLKLLPDILERDKKITLKVNRDGKILILRYRKVKAK